MTGYGAASRPWPEEDLRLTVEVRSVNARYREVRVRSDFGLAAEHAIGSVVARRIGRGRCTVAVVTRPLADEAEGISARIAGRFDLAIHRTQRLVGMAGGHGLELATPSIRDLLATVGPVASLPPSAPPWLDALVDAALDGLVAARREEGAALERELRSLLDEIEAGLEAVDPAVATRRSKIAAEVAEKVRDLAAAGLSAPGGERIEQEVAVLLLRSDPREERVRLAAHVDRVRQILDEPAAPGQGRRLEFLGQEMAREASTLGTKAAGAGADEALLRIRLAVDRFREQVQNVE